MPPNARAFIPSSENELFVLDQKDELLELLDKQADTDGLKNVNTDAEDWTDVKHSERKKRDRILDDGVLIGLMKKSDIKGFERLTLNLSIMALTAFAIHKLDMYSHLGEILENPSKIVDYIMENPGKALAFAILYPFYGFQFQCFAFAGKYRIFSLSNINCTVRFAC